MLQIDTTIPYGNACDTAVTEKDGLTEIEFAPDPHGGPETLWFCFRIANEGLPAAQPQVNLVLKQTYNMLGGHVPQFMRPVIRYAGENWQRLGAPLIAGLPDGRSRVVWTVDAPRSSADVAYCYPYGRPEVGKLVEETDGFWQLDTIGVSQGSRPVQRLSNGSGAEGGNRPGLYLIARQHAGETPGSWVLDGFLRYLTICGDNAPLVWAVPLSNVDGVEGGDYGKDNFPYDLNRAWGAPPMRHETLVIQRDVKRWMARCKPALAIDFHAPGACETDGVYCFLQDPKTYPEYYQAVLGWTAAVKVALSEQYAARAFERVVTYASRWETPNFAAFCWQRHRVCGLSVETPYAMIGDLVLNRERYREIGARMAQGIVTYLL
ncbi:MAG: hypothetical protein JXA89_23525 [Anaerolineae bacterium]|nr:hypothetical protein [Anaerolineae bacterium]